MSYASFKIYKPVLKILTKLVFNFITSFVARKFEEKIAESEINPIDLFGLTHLLYILTSIWVLSTPNAGQNLNFQHFFAKKLKKR